MKNKLFVETLYDLPDSFWERNLKLAYNKAKYFPESGGSGPFLRGEGSELHIIESLNSLDSRFIENQDKDLYAAAPDGLFLDEDKVYFDVKMKVNGFEPGPRVYFKSKSWDFKKTQASVSEFKTDSDYYLMIDPINFRVALCDSDMLKRKKFKSDQSRISFSVKPDDVLILYDGSKQINYSPEIKGRLRELHGIIQMWAEEDLVLYS